MFFESLKFRAPAALASVALVLVPTVQAQIPGVTKSEVEAPLTVNGYAEQLKPRVQRPAAARGQPYAPIKRPNDEGQVAEIEMFVGESRVFPAPGVGRIAVGNGALLTAAALDGKEIILFANGTGTSSLFIWNEDGRYQRLKVNIVPGDTSRFAREIAAFLSGIPKARASIIGDKVIVEGDDLTDSDLARIELLSTRYPQIVNFTNRLGFEQMVMMDVKVVEFPVSELRELGLKWDSVGGAAIGGIWSPGRRGSGDYGIAVGAGANGGSAPISTGFDNPLPSALKIRSLLNLGLNATLNLLAQEGKTVILAEPQLSARNGAEANFLAGGEIPYAVSTINGPTIQFKPYGVRLKIQPQVDRKGNIRAKIDTEVSQIDNSFSTASGPGLLTRKTNTEFNVRNGETIVISGLIQRENSSSVDKVPFLGDVPVVGALFRSRRFQNKETELVVFVTPTVIDSQSAGMVDRIEKTNLRLQDRLGQAPHLMDPLQPGRNPARLDLPVDSSQRAAAAPAPAVPAPRKPALAPTPVAPAELMVLATPETPKPITPLAPVETLPAPVPVPQPAAVEPAIEIAPAPALPAKSGSRASGPLAKPMKSAQAKALTLNNVGVGRPYMVLRDELPLFVAPDINAAASQNLKLGQRVRALETPTRGGWTAVDADGARGWVPTMGLALTAPGAAK